MRKLTFVLSEDETTTGGRCWLVACPQIAGFTTQGASVDEALEMAASLLSDFARLSPDWLDGYADAVTSGGRVRGFVDGVELTAENTRR